MSKKYSTILKIVVSIGALWLVFTKVNLSEILQAYQNTNVGWLLLGFLGYGISRVMGAFRLNYCLRDIGIRFSEINNLKLYLLGMYYSLFLPGSIGGDGYKVYWLKQRFTVKMDRLIAALVFDRFNGLMVIGLLLTIMYFGLGLPYGWVGLVAAGFGVVVVYVVLKYWIKQFVNIFFITILISVAFHLIQIGSIICILNALGVTSSYLGYGFLFLVSSIAAVIPFTVGGAGARELTFLYGATYLNLAEPIAVAVSLMFYLFSLIVALCGVYFSFFPNAIQPTIAKKSTIA